VDPQFQFNWASKRDLSKLLRTPFGISITTTNVDEFLLDQTD
jgi:hypothetical protein